MLNFWLWSKNLIYYFSALLKDMWGLSQHYIDTACSLPWGSTGMWRELCVFQSCRRSWDTLEDPKCGLVSFMLFPHTFLGAHSKTSAQSRNSCFAEEKNGIYAVWAIRTWKETKQKLWTLMEQIYYRLHFRFHSPQYFPSWKRCLTNHTIYIYLAIQFPSSGMNFERHAIIEQGSKNHLLVS